MDTEIQNRQRKTNGFYYSKFKGTLIKIYVLRSAYENFDCKHFSLFFFFLFSLRFTSRFVTAAHSDNNHIENGEMLHR